MKLSYFDVIDEKRKEVNATITDGGQVFLEDGNQIMPPAWYLFNYKIISATAEETILLREWINSLSYYGYSALARKGGSTKSEKKTASSRENGKLGGRPKKGG